MANQMKRGQAGEKAAAGFYRRRLFRVEAQNVRIGRWELDLVVRRGNLLVFAEVKSRGPGSLAAGPVEVSPAQRRRILGAAKAYLARRDRGSEPRCRFDILEVSLDEGGSPQGISHYADAFRDEEAL